jgi:hypothetical protein
MRQSTSAKEQEQHRIMAPQLRADRGSDATASTVEKIDQAIHATMIDSTSRSSEEPLVLNEANSAEHTAYAFSIKKKWWILTVVALCQTSMSKLLMC